MAVFETVVTRNWHDLHLQIDDYFTHYNSYIFRGQADSTWKLESSLTRAIRQNYPNADPAEVRSLTKAHLENFKRSIRGRCNLELSSVDDARLWALGQHFGLYTPLLDWSRSPYVALFFSLFGPCQSKVRALWAVLESDIYNFWPKPSSPNAIRIIQPLGHENQRLVNQGGLFLQAPVGSSIENMIQAAKESEYVTMYKFEYPDEIRNDVLAALSNMNIHHASLFPDLNGASLFANSQLEMEPTLELARSSGFIGEF